MPQQQHVYDELRRNCPFFQKNETPTEFTNFCREFWQELNRLEANPGQTPDTDLFETVFYRKNGNPVAHLGGGAAVFKKDFMPRNAAGVRTFGDFVPVLCAFRREMAAATNFQEKRQAFLRYQAAFKSVCRNENGEKLTADAPHIHRIAATLFPEELAAIPCKRNLKVVFDYLCQRGLLAAEDPSGIVADWFTMAYQVMSVLKAAFPEVNASLLSVRAWQLQSLRP